MAVFMVAQIIPNAILQEIAKRSSTFCKYNTIILCKES